MVFPLIVVAFAGIGVTRLALLALELTDPEQINSDEKNVLPKSVIAKLMVEKEKPKKMLLLENGTQYIQVWDDEDLRDSNPWQAAAARVIQHAKEIKERSELVMYLRETFGLNNNNKSSSLSKPPSPSATAVGSTSSSTIAIEAESDLLRNGGRNEEEEGEGGLLQEATTSVTTTTIITTTTTRTTTMSSSGTVGSETEASIHLIPGEQGNLNSTSLKCITKEIDKAELTDKEGRKEQQDILESSPTSASSTLGTPTSSLTEEELEEIRLRKEAKVLMQQQMIAENMKIIEQNGDQNMCVICYDAKIDAVLIGCGHSSLCFSCSVDCYRNTKECPLCRKEIEQILQVNMEARKILPVRKKKDDSNPLDPLGLFRGSNDSSKAVTTKENLPDEMTLVPVIGPTAELVEKYELLEKVQNELAEVPDININEMYIEDEEGEQVEEVIEQDQDFTYEETPTISNEQEVADLQHKGVQHVNNTVNNNNDDTLSSASVSSSTEVVAPDTSTKAITPYPDFSNIFGGISTAKDEKNSFFSSNVSNIFEQFQKSTIDGAPFEESSSSQENSSNINKENMVNSNNNTDQKSTIAIPVPAATTGEGPSSIGAAAAANSDDSSTPTNSFSSFLQLSNFFNSTIENQNMACEQSRGSVKDEDSNLFSKTKREIDNENKVDNNNNDDDDDDGESKVELFHAPSSNVTNPPPASIALQPAAGSIF